MSKKLFKKKQQRKDYERKMKANKRLSGKLKDYIINGKVVRMVKKQASLCAGDGILPRSRKFTPKKITK